MPQRRSQQHTIEGAATATPVWSRFLSSLAVPRQEVPRGSSHLPGGPAASSNSHLGRAEGSQARVRGHDHEEQTTVQATSADMSSRTQEEGDAPKVSSTGPLQFTAGCRGTGVVFSISTCQYSMARRLRMLGICMKCYQTSLQNMQCRVFHDHHLQILMSNVDTHAGRPAQAHTATLFPLRRPSMVPDVQQSHSSAAMHRRPISSQVCQVREQAGGATSTWQPLMQVHRLSTTAVGPGAVHPWALNCNCGIDCYSVTAIGWHVATCFRLHQSLFSLILIDMWRHAYAELRCICLFKVDRISPRWPQSSSMICKRCSFTT